MLLVRVQPGEPYLLLGSEKPLASAKGFLHWPAVDATLAERLPNFVYLITHNYLHFAYTRGAKLVL